MITASLLTRCTKAQVWSCVKWRMTDAIPDSTTNQPGPLGQSMSHSCSLTDLLITNNNFNC